MKALQMIWKVFWNIFKRIPFTVLFSLFFIINSIRFETPATLFFLVLAVPSGLFLDFVIVYQIKAIMEIDEFVRRKNGLKKTSFKEWLAKTFLA